MPSSIKKLLFVDTNIWLDFYRARTEAGLKLLDHLEAVAERIIVTYQLEIEFKKNRHAAILDGLKELKSPEQIPRIGLFSDAKATTSLSKNLKEADKKIKTLKTKLGRALANPAQYDPVYKVCQRIFHRDDSLVLTRDNPVRHKIRRLAFRRFLHGCPPRKKNDTSFGDSFNWEWMLECAQKRSVS
jgi:hypothetical protein